MESQYANQCAGLGEGRSDEWYTPTNIIRALGEFDLDPACGPLCMIETAKTRYGEMGLEKDWFGRVWLNPPFSNARPWVQKLIEHGDGIALVFARTDAQWFQRAIQASGWCFMFHGRISFIRPTGKASRCPLGCVLIPFGKNNRRAVEDSGLDGTFVRVEN